MDAKYVDWYLKNKCRLIPIDPTAVDEHGRWNKQPIKGFAWSRNQLTREQAIARTEPIAAALPRGLIVLDWDPRNDENNGWTEYIERTGLQKKLDRLPCVETQSGGRHYYVNCDVDFKPKGSLLPGLDVKTKGGYVLCGGSSGHESKPNAYKWLQQRALNANTRLPKQLKKDLERRVTPIPNRQDDEVVVPIDWIEEILEGLPVESYRERHDDWKSLASLLYSCNPSCRDKVAEWSASDEHYGEKGAQGIRSNWETFERGSRAHVFSAMGSLLQKHVKPADEELFERYSKKLDDWKRPSVASAAFNGGVDPEWDKLIDEGDAKKPPSDQSPQGEKPKRHTRRVYCGPDYIVEEVADDEGTKQWATRSAKSLQTEWFGQKVRDGDNLVAKYEAWWSEQPKFRRFILRPDLEFGSQKDGRFNLWEGWPIEPMEGDWESTVEYDFILNGLCAGDEQAYDYLFKWLAYSFQKPWLLPQVATLIVDRGGTGKSIFLAMLAKMAGRYGITAPAAYLSRFNAKYHNKLFAFLDDITEQRDVAFNTLTTNVVLQYEEKFLASEEGRNSLSVLATANRMPVNLADYHSRRRVFLLRPDSFGYDTSEHYDALMQMRGLPILMHRLLAVDIGDWSPSPKIYRVKGYTRMLLSGLPDPVDWWYEYLRDDAGQIALNEEDPDHDTDVPIDWGIMHASYTHKAVDKRRVSCPTAWALQNELTTLGLVPENGNCPRLTALRKAFCQTYDLNRTEAFGDE